MPVAARLAVTSALALGGSGLLCCPVIADEVLLSTGDTLIATVLKRTSESIVVDHAVLGRLEIPLGHVTAIHTAADAAEAENSPGGAQPVEGGETDANDVAAGVYDQDDEPEDSSWKSRFELAFGGSFGNTDTQNFRVGVTSKREANLQRTSLDSSYFYGASNGDRTDNRLTTGVLHEWLMSESPWLFFADGRYDYDEFQSWEHRISGHGGVGYELINRDDFTLNLRGGLGASKEFNSDDDDVTPELLFGGNLTWKISERQSLEGNSTIYPDLGDYGEFRTLSRLSWVLKVDPESNMSLNAGLEHEYQSDVGPDNDKHDLRLFAGLVFDF